MIDYNYEGYGYRSNKQFVPLQVQHNAKYAPAKDIKNLDPSVIEGDVIQPDLLVMTCACGD